LYAVAEIHADSGAWDKAREYAERAATSRPDHRQIEALRERIRRRTARQETAAE